MIHDSKHVSLWVREAASPSFPGARTYPSGHRENLAAYSPNHLASHEHCPSLTGARIPSGKPAPGYDASSDKIF